MLNKERRDSPAGKLKYDTPVNHHHNRHKSNDHALVNHDYKSQTKKGKSDELHTVIRASYQSADGQPVAYRLTVSCRSTCMPFNLYAGQPVPSYLLPGSATHIVFYTLNAVNLHRDQFHSDNRRAVLMRCLQNELLHCRPIIQVHTNCCHKLEMVFIRQFSCRKQYRATPERFCFNI